MTRILTRLLIVAFQVLRTPLVVHPRPVIVRPEFRRIADKPRFSYWWRA